MTLLELGQLRIQISNRSGGELWTLIHGEGDKIPPILIELSALVGLIAFKG